MLDTQIELVPGLIRAYRKDGRCLYDKAAKRELVRRCLDPGVSVAGLALAHGLNANLLRKWIDALSGKVRARRVRTVAGAQAALLPVKIQESDSTDNVLAAEGRVEIVVAGGTIRVYGRIDAAALRTVLDCMASRA